MVWVDAESDLKMLTIARLLIALIFLVLAVPTEAHSHTANDVIIGKVVSVADGDTITVLENNNQYRIRLFGIDAPERRHVLQQNRNLKGR